MDHTARMQQVLETAEQAMQEGEVPGAALLVMDDDEAVAQPRVRRDDSLAAHPELLVLLDADCNSARGATIYTLMEPCLMCYGALLNVDVDAVIYGMDVPQGAFTKHNMQPPFEVVPHVLEQEAVSLVNRFREEHEYAADYVKELLVPYKSQMTLFGDDADG